MEEKVINTEQDKEALFEVETTASREGVCEWFDKIEFTWWKEILPTFVLFILSVINFLLWQGAFGFIVTAIVSPVMIALFIARRKRFVRKTMDYVKSIGDNEPHDPKFFYNETFRYNGDYEHGYEDVNRIIVGKISLYLMNKDLFFVALSKSAFTTGTYPEFVAFLSEKLADNPKAVNVLQKELRKLER